MVIEDKISINISGLFLNLFRTLILFFGASKYTNTKNVLKNNILIIPNVKTGNIGFFRNNKIKIMFNKIKKPTILIYFKNLLK